MYTARKPLPWRLAVPAPTASAPTRTDEGLKTLVESRRRPDGGNDREAAEDAQGQPDPKLLDQAGSRRPLRWRPPRGTRPPTTISEIPIGSLKPDSPFEDCPGAGLLGRPRSTE